MSIAESVRLQALEALVSELRKRLETLEKRRQSKPQNGQPRVH